MKLGEIRWVELLPRGGHAQAGKRPAIIFQDEENTKELPTVLIIPLTTQQDALRFAGTIFVEATTENGLRRASVALVFQLTAVDKRFVKDSLGAVSDELMQSIFGALDTLTGRKQNALKEEIDNEESE
jgi:mRNA-degrading endonuclease toxin of MazEF toxin-antitoxin module